MTKIRLSIASCYGDFYEASELRTTVLITGSGEKVTATIFDEILSEDIRLPDRNYFNQTTSYLGAETTGKLSSSAYRAMFVAAHSAEEYSLAWDNLETANLLEKTAREVKFNKHHALDQLRQLKGVFSATFWDGLITPKVKRKSSTFPIFIVGMMRWT